MQPYFLPYLGYWQLISLADKFVVYDDVEFTKKGWINRNRYLAGNQDQIFTLPLKKDSDYLDVRNRRLADSWQEDKVKFLRKIEGAYRKAPYFNQGFELLKECINTDAVNLFDFILNSILVVKRALEIPTDIIVSSSLGDTTNLKSQDRVIEICKRVNASTYINPIGGIDLYSKDDFSKFGLALSFHRIRNVSYHQFGTNFIPNLSVLDVVMFNGIEQSKQYLNEFDVL